MFMFNVSLSPRLYYYASIVILSLSRTFFLNASVASSQTRRADSPAPALIQRREAAALRSPSHALGLVARRHARVGRARDDEHGRARVRAGRVEPPALREHRLAPLAHAEAHRLGRRGEQPRGQRGASRLRRTRPSARPWGRSAASSTTSSPGSSTGSTTRRSALDRPSGAGEPRGAEAVGAVACLTGSISGLRVIEPP